MRILSFILPCYLFLQSNAMAQEIPADTIPQSDKVYNVKWKYELPGAVAYILGSSFAFKELDKVAALDESDILKLHPADVNSFDRPVIFRDPAHFAIAFKRSDLFLNLSVLSPIILGLDKEVRKDWLDLISMYLVTHAVDNTLYFAMAYSIRRPRPLTYSDRIPMEAKVGTGRSNSFFSGHVSFSATSTFFLVKVFTDYHEIKGLKRILLYTAASVPPALVGYYRMRAGRHFKSDVIVGYLVGASSGILIPEIHRNKGKERKIALEPFYAPGYSGVSMKVALN